MKKTVIVFQVHIANKLLQEGFRMVSIADNKHKAGVVFFFENSKALRDYLLDNFNIKVK